MVVQEDGPIFWIHQAFAVAASIILVLDLLHRSPIEQEFLEQKTLVEETLHILRDCKNSMIAARGEKLLSALLVEVDRCAAEARKRKHDDRHKRPRGLNVSKFVKSFCNSSGGAGSTQAGGAVTGMMHMPQQQAGGMLPDALYDSQSGAGLPFDGEYGQNTPLNYALNMGDQPTFENLLYLANNDFPMM